MGGLGQERLSVAGPPAAPATVYPVLGASPFASRRLPATGDRPESGVAELRLWQRLAAEEEADPTSRREEPLGLGRVVRLHPGANRFEGRYQLMSRSGSAGDGDFCRLVFPGHSE